MTLNSASVANKSDGPPVAHPGAPLASECAKSSPLPEIPYKPYEKLELPDAPYEPYKKKLGLPEAPYKPYTENPAVPEAPYEPYKDI